MGVHCDDALVVGWQLAAFLPVFLHSWLAGERVAACLPASAACTYACCHLAACLPARLLPGSLCRLALPA